MTVAAVYLAVVLFGALLGAGRRGPTLLRGESFFRLTVAFVGLAAVLAIQSRETPSTRRAAFWIAVAAGSWLVKGMWVVIGGRREATAAALESALRTLLLDFGKTPDGYRLTLGGDSAHVRLLAPLPGAVILAFGGNRDHRKVQLFLSLLAKKFQPIIPRPTIDLR